MATKDISIENMLLVLNELTVKFQESEKRFEEREREREKRFEESEKRYQKSQQEWQEIKALFQETDKKFQETDKKINKVHGEFTSQWGKLVEAIVRPSCLRLFRARGIDVSRTHENTTIERDGIKKAEYDAILANGSEVVIVEVKTKLRKKDVEYFTKKLGEVKTYMPEYANKKVYGAMAAISFDREADKEAIKKGLFLIKGSGEGVVDIANSKDFKPKAY